MIDLKCVRRGCMKFAILKQNRKSWWKSQDNPKTRIFEERAIVTSVKRKLAKLLFETCEGLFLILNLFRRFIYIYVCVRVCVCVNYFQISINILFLFQKLKLKY